MKCGERCNQARREIARLAAMTTLWERFKKNLVSVRFILFVDGDGEMHLHVRPEMIPIIEGWVYDVALTGWGKRHYSYHMAGDDASRKWEVIDARGDFDFLTVKDDSGRVISGLTWYEFLSIAKGCDGVQRIIKHADASKWLAKELEAVREELYQAKKEMPIRVALTEGIKAVLWEIHAKQNTMGKSKHAQAIRLSLEALLERFGFEIPQPESIGRNGSAE